MSKRTPSTTIVITSINAPNQAMKMFAEGALAHNWRVVVVGDEKSPRDFAYPGIDFFDVSVQKSLDFKLAGICPSNHYVRKNIGYLIAISGGCEHIVETDDDNLPYDTFWNPEIASGTTVAPAITEAGWLNVYSYFSKQAIWPRGLPLDAIHLPVPDLSKASEKAIYAPIRQGLADDNPDVDAIYRLLYSLPTEKFATGRVALGPGTWCPFNSQNTIWWREAFPLLYLPASCSFRMTDIWRSFVAQRIAWENDWYVLFESASVYQERNQHDLMKDFSDEVPGYLNNNRIMEELARLSLCPGRDAMADNLIACYGALVKMQLLDPNEMTLLDAWLEDLGSHGVI